MCLFGDFLGISLTGPPPTKNAKKTHTIRRKKTTDSWNLEFPPKKRRKMWPVWISDLGEMGCEVEVNPEQGSVGGRFGYLGYMWEQKLPSDLGLRRFFADCTMVNHYQTTVWENMFCTFFASILCKSKISSNIS